MIRRQVAQEYWLITQHDHAMLAGALARKLGQTPPPPTGESAILGIELHDCGWPGHDDQPTLNKRRAPTDVFETGRQVALAVWLRSVEIAVERDPYAGLLVSLHVLALSNYATQQRILGTRSWDLKDARTRFEVNVFQHRIIEIQEGLRTRLGLRTDRPLKGGLAIDPSDPAEAGLVSDFHWLQAMDMMSLAICCTKPPFRGHPDKRLTWQREGINLTVAPWPFDEPEVKLEVPFRRIPARPYTDPTELHEAIAATDLERFTVAILPDTIR
jgi:hypothetical protein